MIPTKQVTHSIHLLQACPRTIWYVDGSQQHLIAIVQVHIQVRNLHNDAGCRANPKLSTCWKASTIRLDHLLLALNLVVFRTCGFRHRSPSQQLNLFWAWNLNIFAAAWYALHPTETDDTRAQRVFTTSLAVKEQRRLCTVPTSHTTITQKKKELENVTSTTFRILYRCCQMMLCTGLST